MLSMCHGDYNGMSYSDCIETAQVISNRLQTGNYITFYTTHFFIKSFIDEK